MCPLFVRLIELRDEYFNELTNRDLYTFYKLDLDVNTQYTSDTLINMMCMYADLLYPRS